MKKYIFFILFDVVNICAFAQFNTNELIDFPKYKVLGKSNTECIYVHTIKDVVLNQKKSHDDILLIGSKYSRFFDYGVYQIDSITFDGNKKEWTVAENYDLVASYPHRSSLFEIRREIGSNKLTYIDLLVIEKYLYEDSVSFKWKIGKEKMTICGYPCRKATCVFRGRKWEAWFTNKISVSLGPWKFCGLPGLILRVNDDKHEHVFYATCVRKGGSPIRKFERSYIKSTREKVNKIFKAYHEDCSTYWGNSVLAPKDLDGNPVEIPSKRLFFNAIEKE